MRRLIFVVICLSLLLIKAVAQEASDENKKKAQFLNGRDIHDIRPDFLVPESPAFSVLGVNAENVIRPETPRDLALSLLNGVDPQGNMQTGIALDFTPYLLIRGTSFSLAEYRHHPFEQFLSRIQLSFATTKGSSEDDKSLRAAVGLRFTVVDLGDARTDKLLDKRFFEITDQIQKQDRAKLDVLSIRLAKLEDRIDKATSDEEKGKINQQIEEIDADIKELKKVGEQQLQSAWKQALDEHNKGTWNATNIAFGVAPVFFSTDGSFDKLTSEGVTVYSTVAFGFDIFKNTDGEPPSSALNWLRKNAQMLVHARYAVGEKKPLDNGMGFRKQDSAVVGAQLRMRGPSIWSKEDKGGDFTFSLEGDYIYTDFRKGGDDTFYRFIAAVEIKPFKNAGVTLKLSVGGETQRRMDGDNAFVLSAISWALD